MFTHPDRIGQLAREHHHQMLAQASQRQLRHQHSRPAATTRIIRRLAALIAGAGVVPAQAPGTIWPARPHPLSEPAGRTPPAVLTGGISSRSFGGTIRAHTYGVAGTQR